MKNKFLKSAILLIIGGFITKIISMFIKIVLARMLGPEGMGLYMLISPTFMLLIAISQLGFPIAISKLVAEEKRSSKNLVLISIITSLILNVFIIIFLFMTSNFISQNLLNEPRCKYAISCIGLVLPLISISSILRGYFFGKQKMIPHILSNITEDIVRLIALIIGIPIFLKSGLEYAVAFIVLVNIISEFTSIIVLFLFLPKKIKIEKKDLNKKDIKEILNIGIPATLSRIIGIIGFFFEPIILTYVLLKCGYENKYILNEYGIINGYIMPLVLLPSFFTLAISEALIPNISKAQSEKNYKYIKSKLKQAIFLSLLIGIPATLIFEIVPEIPMKLIYNTKEGIEYIKVFAIIALMHYIQSPLTSTLQAMGKAKEAMNGTLIGTIARVISLYIFSYFKIGLWSLIIASSFNIIITTIHQYIHIKKALKVCYNKKGYVK